MAEALGGNRKPIDFNNYIGGEEALASAARNVRSLGKDITALSKTIGDDSGRIAAGFATIKQGIADIQAKAGKLNLFSAEDKAVLAALAQQLGELKKRQEDYRATVAAQATVQRGLTDVARQYTSELAKQKDALRAAALANDVEGQKKVAAAIRETTQQTTQLSKALRGANSEFTAAKGSYDALVIENNKLLASLHALGDGVAGNNVQAKKLQEQIYANTQVLKDFDTATNRSFREVGNYSQGFSGLIAELAKARAAQASYTEGSAAAAQGQMRISGFQTAAQKSAAQMGLSYEQAEAKINGVTSAIQPLANNLVRLEKEQADVALGAGKESEAFRVLGFQIERTKKDINDVAAAQTHAGESSNGLTQQLGLSKEGLGQFAVGLAASAIGIQALFQGIVSGVGAAFGADSEFQSALSSLSALTGATGDDLQFLADKAEELGPQVGKSAAETLKAFELIGSAQPELLKNKEALAAVTEQVLLLAAASGDALPDAADALTGVMNQFQAPAAEAARYVNALAAGAKEGAATIPQAAASLKYFGVNAAAANISVEKSVALIQTLAERSIKGEQAGTQLRNILAKLASGAKETNPEVVGLSTALDNLGKQNLSTAQYTKLFGLENANTAKILVQNREKVEQLTVAVTGTQTANEQAAKQLDNSAVAAARFGAVIKNIAINALDGLNRSFGASLNAISDFLQRLAGVTKSYDEGVDASYRSAAANMSLASSTRTLLDRYNELTHNGLAPTTASKKELSVITLQLRDALGESVTAINKETGELVLNTAAVEQAIKQKLLLANQEASSLALRAKAALDEQKQADFAAKAATLELSTSKDRLATLGLTVAGAERLTKLSAESSNNKVLGYSQEQQDAADSYLRTQQKLTTATLASSEASDRYNKALEALRKLGFNAADIQQLFAGATTAAANAQTKLGDAAAGTERILDRAAKAQAEASRRALQAQLSATEQQISDIKKGQEEAAKLFADKQITEAAFADVVAGTQDKITALERKGAAIRKAIARQEANEKIIAINDEAIKSSRAKGVTSAELTDIKAAAAIRVKAERDALREASSKIDRELQDKLEVKPLEFKVAGFDAQTLKAAEDAIYGPLKVAGKTYEQTLDAIAGTARNEMATLAEQFASGKITRQQYEDQLFEIRKNANKKALKARDDFHKAENEQDLQAAQDEIETAQRLAEKRKAIADKAGNTLLTIDGYYSQFRQNGLDAREQDIQAQYDNEVKAAGENKELLAAIEKKHDKELRKLAHDRAAVERDQAAFTIAVQTAVAVAKAFAESPATFGLPFSAVALANGLIQEALIYSKPLPAYFKGRRGGPAELAEVSERGPELIQRASTGRFEYIAERAIVPLGHGDNVYTAQHTAELLASVGLRHSEAQQPERVAAAFSGAAQQARASREDAAGQGIGALSKGQREIAEALRKFKPTVVHVHRGSDASVQASNSLRHYMSQRQFK